MATVGDLEGLLAANSVEHPLYRTGLNMTPDFGLLVFHFSGMFGFVLEELEGYVDAILLPTSTPPLRHTRQTA